MLCITIFFGGLWSWVVVGGICLLDDGCMLNKYYVNIMTVCSTRLIDIGFGEYCIIDYFFNGYACMIFLKFVY